MKVNDRNYKDKIYDANECCRQVVSKAGKDLGVYKWNHEDSNKETQYSCDYYHNIFKIHNYLPYYIWLQVLKIYNSLILRIRIPAFFCLDNRTSNFFGQVINQ